MAEYKSLNLHETPGEEGIELKDINKDEEDDKTDKIIPGETPYKENLINNSGTAPPIFEIENNKKNDILNCSKKNLIIILIILFTISLISFFLLFSKKNIINETVIGLYFGSLNSGYYIIKNKNLSLSNCIMNYSDIILDEYGFRGLEYGYKAHIHSKNDLKNEKRIYFSNIKKYLLTNESLENKTILSDAPQGKEIPLSTILEEYFNLLKKTIKKNENIRNINSKNTKWIIAIPTIWGEDNKAFLKDILEDLDMENFEFISEADAASMGVFYEEKIKEFLVRNKAYMLVNIDLFNIEIIVNKILDKKNNLRQLMPNMIYNDHNGSYIINEEILNILEQIFGYEDINDKKNNDYDKWQITLDDIEKKKLLINDNMVEDLDIVTEFSQGYKKYMLKDIWSSDYQNYKINHSKGKVFIPLDILNKLIYKISQNLILEIENLIKKINEKIDIIIITGEFSKSNVLQKNLIRNFEKSSYKLFFLDDIEKTIIKGATIYGFKPNKIKKFKIKK